MNKKEKSMRRNDNTLQLKVSEVSRVSKVSKMSKQGEQQSLHSLLPMGEGGRRPDEGADYVRSYMETAKEVRSTVKNTLAPCGRGQNLLANECELRNSGEGADKSALTHGETAKDAHDSLRHPELVSGSHHAASLEDVTPHQVRTKLAKRSLSPTILSPEGEEIHDETSHEAAEPKNVKDLTSYRPNVLTTSKKAAFTLAEVLITLAVIGVVAVLTIPGLIKNHNEKAWATAKDLWEKKLTETVRRMNTDGVMTGYDTTEDFMDSFKQYMKVIKTCDNNDLNKCYSPEFVLTGKRDNLEKKYIEDFKTANDLGVSDWNTNTMSFVISDGTTVIAAYNPNCPYADPIEDTGSQVACLSMMIDVNGKKSPNRVGKDILLSNATISTCDNPIGDICFSTDFQSTALDTTLDENKPLDSYRHQTNYFAGALKACSEKNMSLPTLEQLAQIANEIYVGRDGKPINLGATENNNSLQLKNEYRNNPPLTIGDSDIGIPYFASDESPQGYIYARTRYFYYDRTTAMGAFFNKSSSARVICASN